MNDCIELVRDINCNGYSRVRVDGKRVLAHRAAYCNDRCLPLWAIANKVIMHICDNRLCVNPQHLALGTIADNIHDMLRKERHSKGSERWNAKLSESDVRNIRTEYAAGAATQRELGERYGIDQSMISTIVNGKNWRHVRN